VRDAIELGATSRGGLSGIVRQRDWVVIKPHIAVCQRTDGSCIAGSVTDLRVVRSVIEWLAEHRLGSRISIAEIPSWAMGPTFDVWESDWDGAFGGTSYRGMVEELGRRHPSIRFDIVDLAGDETTAVQPPGRFSVSPRTPAVYNVPATLLDCDNLITVAPLSTSSWTEVSLTLGSYLGALPSARRERLREKTPGPGDLDDLLVDLYSIRPADYAILGGEWGLEGDGPYGPDADPVHHTLILGGASAVAVDAVGAAVMGFDPSGIKHLELAARRGFGVVNTDSVWTRGNEIDEAKRPFRPAAELRSGD